MVKRRKHANKLTSNEMGNAENDTSIKRDVFPTIPIELLSMILHDLLPTDILSVARTSRHFCRILTDPQADRIWKRARQAFVVPVPDPLPIFTESAYAVFVFDDGICEVGVSALNRMRIAYVCDNLWLTCTMYMKRTAGKRSM